MLDADSVGATWARRRTRARWTSDLQRAFKVLYPDGDAPGFRPSVADFFTVLEVMAQVHEGRERLPLPAQKLLDDLRCEIALGLEATATSLSIDDTPHFGWFSGPACPSVVVTTNWDTLAERAARSAGLAVRLTWPLDSQGRRRVLKSGELLVLKIHGSTDWGTSASRTVQERPIAAHYSNLETPIGDRSHFPGGRIPNDRLLRFRSLEAAAPGGKLGFDPPQMATMAVGKQASIDLLAHAWDDAYWCLSRAKTLNVIGYSFPDDDLEIRSLLRVATRRAGESTLDDDLTMRIVNPSPDAHDRARASLGTTLLSDYRSGGNWP